MREVAFGLKTIIFLLAAAFSFSACGSSKLQITLFPKEAASAEVIYTHAAIPVAWEMEDEETEAVKAWADGLELQYVTFSEGSTPADTEGGMCYDFTINDGESAFSYVDSGRCYILFQNEWYEVKNPSEPPVEMRVQFAGRTVKASALSEDTLKWLEWYNALSEEEQSAVSFVPGDLLEASGIRNEETAAVETAAEAVGQEEIWEPPLASLYWGMDRREAEKYYIFSEANAAEQTGEESVYLSLAESQNVYGFEMEVVLTFDERYGLVEVNARCAPEEVQELQKTLTEHFEKEAKTQVHLEDNRILWQTEPLNAQYSREEVRGFLKEEYGSGLNADSLEAIITAELGSPLVSCVLYTSGEREGTLCLDAGVQARLRKWVNPEN